VGHKQAKTFYVVKFYKISKLILFFFHFRKPQLVHAFFIKNSNELLQWFDNLHKTQIGSKLNCSFVFFLELIQNQNEPML